MNGAFPRRMRRTLPSRTIRPETPPTNGSTVVSLGNTAGVKRSGKSRRETAFRGLLVLGAAVSVAIGVWAVVGATGLQSVLAKSPTASVPEFAALARLYGAAMLALGLGYALAAAQPHGRRGLLVVLFVAPAISGIVLIASLARGEIPAGRGLALAIYDFAYCLLFFRTYPRVESPTT